MSNHDYVKEVARIAYEMLTRRRIPCSGEHLSRVVDAVCSRKWQPPTARDAAEIVVERVATTARRLGHGTGATGWLD